MKVVFDTNVLLDLLLDREPHQRAAARLTALVERGALTGVVGATTVTTIFYFASKSRGSGPARAEIDKILRLFEVAPVTRGVLQSALGLPFPDFEDAVLHEAGVGVGAQAIVTRNGDDFALSTLRVYSPNELLAARTPKVQL